MQNQQFKVWGKKTNTEILPEFLVSQPVLQISDWRIQHQFLRIQLAGQPYNFQTCQPHNNGGQLYVYISHGFSFSGEPWWYSHHRACIVNPPFCDPHHELQSWFEGFYPDACHRHQNPRIRIYTLAHSTVHQCLIMCTDCNKQHEKRVARRQSTQPLSYKEIKGPQS